MLILKYPLNVSILKMALSASSPAVKGYLVETDTRWENISMLCDDRTDEEIGLSVYIDIAIHKNFDKIICTLNILKLALEC